ncbi:hypothetical protein [Bowmanella dokdonensis]|uniref:Cobalt transporter n=1 Tax=Bowmanella dokdonensis TaxID=751969 RepID=A0A939ISB5_9ALTE|nr:hypothetical protein [Bowmanella dokdonensis]MBN7826246.1 hypothetical protein [Bowmanella dokdonensis]
MNIKPLIYVLLLMTMHSFFACAGAPFSAADAEHDGYSHLQHLEGHGQHQSGTSDGDPEHQLHVHLSCHTGYGSELCPIFAPACRPAPVFFSYLNLYYQPPVPPPDTSLT